MEIIILYCIFLYYSCKTYVKLCCGRHCFVELHLVCQNKLLALAQTKEDGKEHKI